MLGSLKTSLSEHMFCTRHMCTLTTALDFGTFDKPQLNIHTACRVIIKAIFFLPLPRLPELLIIGRGPAGLRLVAQDEAAGLQGIGIALAGGPL